MVTIKQVAAHAGTSFKTVARVINKEPSVRQATKERVENSIKALGYRPNAAARMMRKGKSGVIGFIANQVSTRADATDIIKGAQELAWQHGKLLMVLNVEPGDNSLQKAIDQLLEFRAEGVIYACRYHQSIELPVDLHNLPTVLVNCFSPSKTTPSVVPDEYLAAYELTSRMIKKGSKRIALLNLIPRIIAASERKRGFIDAHLAAGIEVNDVYIQDAIIEENGIERSVSQQVIEQLMSLDQPPDAIVCGKDQLAMEVYFHLLNRGLKVGQDIQIGSFDNMYPIAETLNPGISTMALPHLAMGRWGMQYLLEGQQHLDQVRLPCEFIERDSF